MPTVLVISTNRTDIEFFRGQSHQIGRVEEAGDWETALNLFHKTRHDYLFFDLENTLPSTNPSRSGFRDVLEPFWALAGHVYVVILTDRDRVRDAISAVRAGVDDYLTRPYEATELELVLTPARNRVLRDAELAYLRDSFWQPDSVNQVATASPVMKDVFQKLQSVAPTHSTVHLTGETGVGKGVVARLIHRHGARSKGPFIAVHCGAIPDTLLESELFGHEKGAFTGAAKRKLGRFELAHRGTIFLDEIGTITPSAQIKLLQVLQDGVVTRVGGEAEIQVDIRVISAANESLKDLTEKGLFRKDLYYRLNVFPIEIPPLRNRPEDIPLLADHFLNRLKRTYGKSIHGIAPEVLKLLTTYAWPGNIRELENLIERAYILETSSLLTRESFPGEIFEDLRGGPLVPVDMSLTLAEARQGVLDNFERQYLKDLLAEKRGRIKFAAEAAGVGVRQLHKLMKKHGLVKEGFK